MGPERLFTQMLRKLLNMNMCIKFTNIDHVLSNSILVSGLAICTQQSLSHKLKRETLLGSNACHYKFILKLYVLLLCLLCPFDC